MTVADTRQKNRNWRCAGPNDSVSMEQATLATLMDIRDELQAIRALANCYRIPRALDAMTELGAEARRKKRAAAKKRKAVGK